MFRSNRSAFRRGDDHGHSASSPVAMTTARYGNDPLYFVKNGVIFTIAGVLLMLLVMRLPLGLFKTLAPIGLLLSGIMHQITDYEQPARLTGASSRTVSGVAPRAPGCSAS